MVFVFIILIAAVYYSYFIFSSSFVINGERFFVLFDDAMISMDYAKSLYKGCGLVWFCGADKVEGFTNLGWTLYMYPIHLLNLPLSKTPLLIQITGAIFLIISGYLVFLSSERLKAGSGIWSSTIFLFYMPAIYWSLMGMEVSALLLITSLSMYLYIKRKTGILPILMALGVFLRMDYIIMVVFFLILPDNLKDRVLVILSVLITLLGMTILRVLYYGDILPNTFYLKASGLDIYTYLRGLYSLLKHLLIFNPFLYALSFLWVIKNLRVKLARVFLIVFALLSIYVVYVGGDVWESSFQSNRFMLNIFPIVAIMCGVYLSEIKNLVFKLSLLLLALTGLHPSRLKVFINPKSEFHISYNERYLRKVLRIKDITEEGAKIAIVMAGIPPYYLENRIFIDFLGKNDRYIAKLPSREVKNLSLIERFKYLPPGHTKWDYSYSIGKLKPDVIVDIWKERFLKEEIEELLKDYEKIEGVGYIRKGSSKIKLR